VGGDTNCGFSALWHGARDPHGKSQRRGRRRGDSNGRFRGDQERRNAVEPSSYHNAIWNLESVTFSDMTQSRLAARGAVDDFPGLLDDTNQYGQD